jgi:hypothetical protein
MTVAMPSALVTTVRAESVPKSLGDAVDLHVDAKRQGGHGPPVRPDREDPIEDCEPPVEADGIGDRRNGDRKSQPRRPAQRRRRLSFMNGTTRSAREPTARPRES